MEIIIDTESVKEYQEFFDDFHSSIFPRVVRNVLNDLAFNMKGGKGQRGTIEPRAKQFFKHNRNKTFIRAMTGVNKATGRNINSMVSEAGVMSKSGKDIVADRLAQQEDGGKIKHTFIPTSRARISTNEDKKVSSRSQHKNLNRYIDLTNSPKNTKIRLLWVAHRQKRPVLIKGRGSRKNKTFLAMPYGKVRGFKKDGKDGNIIVPLKFLYVRATGGFVNLNRKRPFIQRAGDDAFLNVHKFFNKHIEKELGKVLPSIM